MTKRSPSESIEWLAQAIRGLPSDEPVPPRTAGYNTYTTQKDHWLGWLDPKAGTGTYPRQASRERDARDVYNRIVEPRLLAWLISAAGVPLALVQAALRAAESEPKLASQSAAIRRHVPWHILAEALKQRQHRSDS
jgi:hypothetical protein